jgi:hypothetical protein
MTSVDVLAPLPCILLEALRRLAAEGAAAYPEVIVLPANCTIPTFKHLP